MRRCTRVPVGARLEATYADDAVPDRRRERHGGDGRAGPARAARPRPAGTRARTPGMKRLSDEREQPVAGVEGAQPPSPRRSASAGAALHPGRRRGARPTAYMATAPATLPSQVPRKAGASRCLRRGRRASCRTRRRCRWAAGGRRSPPPRRWRGRGTAPPMGAPSASRAAPAACYRRGRSSPSPGRRSPRRGRRIPSPRWSFP